MQPIRLGLLGLNYGEGIARHIIKNVPCLRLCSVCDVDQARAHRVAETLGVQSATLDGLLADPSIEAIALFTDPAERPALIEKIVNAGRHVITSKPFAVDAAATERVLRLAQEKRLVVQMNSPGPEWAEDQIAIERLVREHNLGRVVAFRAETWSHYREKANGAWYDDPEKCPVAPILRLGVSFLNDFAPLVGKPEQVHALESHLFTERPTADQAQISLRFTNGALGSLFASFCVEDGHPYRDLVTINYAHGSIQRWIIRKFGPTMEDDQAVITLHTKQSPPIHLETKPGRFAGWYNWSAFHKAILEGNPITDAQIEAVLYGVRLLEAAKQSSRSGFPVTLPQVKLT